MSFKKRKNKGFQEILPVAISDSNFILALGLIRNDIGDIIYLQNLHIKNSKNYIDQSYSAGHGRFSGRNIFFLRMALSVIHEIFFLLCNKNKRITSDKILSEVIDRLKPSDQDLWNILLAIATGDNSNIAGRKIKPEIQKLKILSDKTRNNLTFHYLHSNKFLKLGFDQAFLNSKKQENNKFACVTEGFKKLTKNRSYYVDLSAQIYMEQEYGDGDLFNDISNETVSKFLYPIHNLFNKILTEYHKDFI